MAILFSKSDFVLVAITAWKSFSLLRSVFLERATLG
jgi:hypothetical protein